MSPMREIMNNYLLYLHKSFFYKSLDTIKFYVIVILGMRILQFFSRK